MAKGGNRYGAGRPGWRRTAEACLRIDVRELARRRLLACSWFSWSWTNSVTGEQSGSVSMGATHTRLSVSYSSNGIPREQSLTIEKQPCHFGGTRPWLRCGDCGRRVAVVYFSGGRFTCRHCGRVSYRSQAEDAIGRAWLRQGKLEARLDEHWKRPRGMRHATYERILGGISDCEEQRDLAIYAHLLRLGFADGL